jgi:hypothetical protein
VLPYLDCIGQESAAHFRDKRFVKTVNSSGNGTGFDCHDEGRCCIAISGVLAACM